jgi:hypothetical protein
MTIFGESRDAPMHVDEEEAIDATRTRAEYCLVMRRPPVSRMRWPQRRHCL